ncbi:MAG: peptide deformylase [Marinobacter psychrophilus]
MILRLLLEVSHTHRELQHLSLLKRDRVKQIMARLQVLEFPDPRLRTKAQPVTDVSTTIHQIVEDMFETMYECKGIGLAATQVNIHQRIIVIDVSEERNEKHVFINPELTILDHEPDSHDEGCLSVPGFYEIVERPKRVKIEALDQHGKSFTIEPKGLLATCIQHEIDHLDGKLFVDYLSPMKRNRIRKKLEKQHRDQA